MSAVDFAAFVDELATLSGKAILPFFRTAIAASDKSRGVAFDPVTEADRAGEAVMRALRRRCDEGASALVATPIWVT